ncbi:4-phytase/acid phosphatase [Novosphingobium sp. PhB165]|uniref:histidine-type phosphatase n=1 Tax=Novosphingobium sp. PhB165 TaxID=2485105 RepID=UPI0010E351CE|nr:histidine-type phosphatase [Novosphingobium sp. PhB165]TCM19386.1 4-phytase/acid phosphatase [Novosphingobium sp. PhB165]
MKRMKLAGIGLAALAAPLAAVSAQAPQASARDGSDLTVDRVVLVMRHGVRPPTKDPAMPAGTAVGDWPKWSVAPGWLTHHGAEAVAALGQSDAKAFRAAGILPARGCPAPGTVRVVADSDQRTIATAEAWMGALAPKCGLTAEHPPQGQPDPLFSAIEASPANWDPAQADAAVLAAAGPGGLAARDAQEQALAARLDAILCGPSTAPAKGVCGISAVPSAFKGATATSRPKLSGMLDKASTAAQVLLLEYADGKPMAEVGWGRASAADVTALSRFHALEFELLARPKPIAAANFAPLAAIVKQGLEGPARITVISGHDTNVANLGGLLDVHWQIPGFAQDDPAPGGAIVIERLHDRAGQTFVRVSYRAQALDSIRNGTGGVVRAAMSPTGCTVPQHPGFCTLAQFNALIDGK